MDMVARNGVAVGVSRRELDVRARRLIYGLGGESIKCE
jgi:hypothetical protein